VVHAALGVQAPLGDAVVGGVRLRDDFTDPIRNDCDGAHVRVGQALASPARQIRPKDVGAETHDDFDEDPPATRPTVAVVVVEGSSEEAAECPLHLRVARQRSSRGDHDFARDELSADRLRQRQ
jgi:hypothetical protein